ncbi:unnamed protein product [Phaedon cochleariae]|uniref:Double jelly roll-like domain-containing protein n=1 Tax=Phaedon cochleariae TaxID=80249 RepID=A0A9N9X5V4_PHACE|nr:unnamed protein product [Phaedon cochleariae]
MMIPFRRWELHELPALTQGSTIEIWSVKTCSALDSPRYVIVFFQTKKADNLHEDVTLFDNANIKSIRLALNSDYYPQERMLLDFSKDQYADAHFNYTEFNKNYHNCQEKRSLVNFAEFKSRPMFVIDCSRRYLGLKSSTVDIKKWDLSQSPALTNGAKSGIWAVETSASVERPRYVIVCFQKAKRDNAGADATHFDNTSIVSIRLALNGEYWPNEKMQLDFAKQDYTLAYYNYTRFYSSYSHSTEVHPILDYGEFKQHALFVIDRSRQEETMKSSTVDIKLEIEADKGFPADTTAYCIILQFFFFAVLDFMIGPCSYVHLVRDELVNERPDTIQSITRAAVTHVTKSEPTMDVNRLLGDELRYELYIRGQSSNNTVADNRARIREVFRSEWQGDMTHFPKVSLYFDNKLEICSRKLEELQQNIDDFDQNNRENEYRRIYSRLLHISGRSNRLSGKDVGEGISRLRVVNKCSQLIDRVRLVDEGLYTTLNSQYGEETDFLTGRVPSTSAPLQNQHQQPFFLPVRLEPSREEGQSTSLLDTPVPNTVEGPE